MMPEGSYEFQVGSMRCAVLSDGYYAYPTDWFFPNADPVRLAEALDRRRLPHHAVITPYSCLLVETGSRVVLIDTGVGPSARTGGALLARLEMRGVRPRDVDTVILTHAHPDHVGGAITGGGRPVFSQARHILSEYEWSFWTRPRPDLDALRVPHDVRDSFAPGAKRCIETLRFQIETVDGEQEVVPGVRVIPAPGHTPGHLAVLVESEGQRLLNLGDAAVHPLHLEFPDLQNGFDQSPADAAATRRELLDRAVSERMRLMAVHFPLPSVGGIAVRPAGGWEWSPGA
jgi:glyoxylase-like metal-dependent hydrolase (beta-lactamase superfamily II)